MGKRRQRLKRELRPYERVSESSSAPTPTRGSPPSAEARRRQQRWQKGIRKNLSKPTRGRDRFGTAEWVGTGGD